ncbi:hypothetical protein B566_EDAN015931 [Ephemera danica]|nr:hypothetical protein B566_EDAN015931 [Ephemera danica]
MSDTTVTAFLPLLPETSDASLCRQISIEVLFNGYSHVEDSTGDVIANCTSTLIRGRKFNVLVDTMTAWDREKLLNALLPMTPNDIHYVVCTHGHSDHVGNNNLFLDAIHIVGFSMSCKDRYFNFSFDKGQEFLIEPGIRVVPTPGHTATDVSVLVDTATHGCVAITGDLFEKEEDITDPSLWQNLGGSEQPQLQQASRDRILAIANYIVPGHGPMFKNPLKPHETSGATAEQTPGHSQ